MIYLVNTKDNVYIIKNIVNMSDINIPYINQIKMNGLYSYGYNYVIDMEFGNNYNHYYMNVYNKTLQALRNFKLNELGL